MDPVIRTSDDIDTQPWTELGGWRGVADKKLLDDPRSRVGIMRMAPDARELPHSHHAASHHVWILDGECRMFGRLMNRGSYGYVPARMEHHLEVGPDGCTMLYVYEHVADTKAA